MALTQRQLECALSAIKQLTSDHPSALIERHIMPHARKGSRAEAVLRDTGVPVWALIGYLPAVNEDIKQVADDYDLPLDAVAGAIYYYAQNKTIIDDRIEANYRSVEV